MAHRFDDDPIGAILDFGLIIPTVTPGVPTERSKQWARANKIQNPQLFVGPAMSRTHLVQMLSPGRNPEDVRGKIDRIFRKLETEHLIEPWVKDGNLDTSYRVVTPLGEELLAEGSYVEYLAGLREVVARWRGSVAKIYHPTDAGIGTGFLVSEALVATARHVVDGLDEFVVELEGGAVLTHGDPIVPEVDWLDLALIPVDGVPGGVRTLTLTTNRDLLEDVVVLGFPPVPTSDDAYLVVNRGEISADVTLRGRHQALIVSCLLRGGNSGGPVINRRAQVVGVVSDLLFNHLGADEKAINEGLGFAAVIPSEWLKDLMNGDV